ncbi:MAG TPA: AarF/UbiB family protein [Puia sp.]|uniref:ABC1 kinase family protein n=1 Tax=Puia sp. TaxID=2045100 RepID=UPI002CB82779|nr:AarF/UbiB family protein [Puia sp.]HVU97971.1 AarF/UbiB family protein [Puia sp.]
METKEKIERMARLVAILVRYGFADVLHRLKKRMDLPALPAKIKRQHLEDYPLYTRIRMALEELGPTYVKLGQLLSTRDDILPPGLVSELQLLQDRVGSVPIDIKALFREQFHTELTTIFSSCDEIPFASASMSQLYHATMKDGDRKIAIKVKRPGIDLEVQTDLLIIKDAANALGEKVEFLRGLHLPSFVAGFEYFIRQELSFVHERINMMRFAANFRDSDEVHAIQSIDELSNDSILCMELVEGCMKINDVKAIVEAGFDPAKIAIRGLNCYLDQIFKFGFFHGDPHPGNIFLRPDGKLVFIDFGNMGVLTGEERERLEKLLISFSRQDIPGLTSALEKMAARCDIPSESHLQKQLGDLVALVDNTAVAALDIKMIFDNLKQILRDNNVQLPDYAYLLIRGITLLEGTGKTLDPQMNIARVIQPYVRQIIDERLSIPNIVKEVYNKVMQSGELLKQLPEDIRGLLTRLRDNKLAVNHRIEGLDRIANKVDKSLDRLSLSIIVTALSVGSAILVHANMPPKLWGVPVLGLAGFFISAVLAVRVVFSIAAKRD